MSSISTVILSVLAVFWLQKISAASGLNIDDSMDSIWKYLDTLTNNTSQNRTGSRNYYGSITIQTGNVYPKNNGGEILYGSQDIQIGNIYSGNPGENVYGPILIQKNNTYLGNGENVQYAAKVTQVNNVYPKNPGKKDIYGPVVIQEDNIYPENSGNNTVFGAIINQTNNTYSKLVETNKNALKAVIHQRRNVNLPPSRMNSVVRTVFNESGYHFHPSQGHDQMPGGRITINKLKRQHEKLKKTIHHHLQTEQSTTKRCADGMMDLERLDEIKNLYHEVEIQVAQLKALQEIKRNQKIICEHIKNQCSKHNDIRKWIVSSMRIVIKGTKQSRERWESLQKC